MLSSLVRAAKLWHVSARVCSHQNCFVGKIASFNLHPSNLERKFCTNSDKPLHEQEPPYLVHLKPPLPTYEKVNVQIRGYDFAVLERFGKYVHNIALELGLDVENAWATPRQSFKISILKPKTNVVNEYHNLALYERNVQIANMPTASISLLIDIVETSLPAGVTLSMHYHEPEHEEIRYIPDLEIQELQEQLEGMGKK